MKISIVTAVYNRAETIAQSMQSVQQQSWGDLEHVIQDGGSGDGTLETVQRLAGPQTRLESAPDRGIYDAINKGIARCSGDVIGLMHSDDFFAGPQVLEKVVDLFERSGAQGVYGDLDYVSAADPDKVVRRWRSGPYSRNKLARGWMPPHPTLYLRREVFEQFGCYDTGFRIAADYEAMLRWLTCDQVSLAYLPEVMVKMRTGGESNRSLEQIVRKSSEDYKAIRRHKIGGVATLFLKNSRKLQQFFVTD